MLKIKIGNFNFITNKDKKTRVYELRRDEIFDNFYLNGKEDTIYTTNFDNFEKCNKEEYKDYTTYNFERELLKNHYVLDLNTLINNRTDYFIRKKSYEMFEKNNYSRYDLYKDFRLSDLEKIKSEDNHFEQNFYDSVIDFEKNRYYKGILEFNPYTEEIENLEELYKEGKFYKNIKIELIKLELEHNLAPKFITSLLKIDNFLQDKKSVNLEFEGFNKFKVYADYLCKIEYLLSLRNNEINIDIRYLNSNFEKQNPDKTRMDLKKEDLKTITYGKTELKIEPEDLKNIPAQIAITLEDKLRFETDKIQEQIDNKYRDIRKYSENQNIPHTIENAMHQLATSTLVPDTDISWYNEELENLFYQKSLLQDLISIDNLDFEAHEAIELSKELSLQIKDNTIHNLIKEYIEEYEKEFEESEEM